MGAEAQHEGEGLEPGLVPQGRESIRGENSGWQTAEQKNESVIVLLK